MISKKVLSLLLVFVICFTVVPVAFAEETTTEYTEEVTTAAITTTEVTTEAETTAPDSDTTTTEPPTTEEPTTEEPTTEEPTTEEPTTEEPTTEDDAGETPEESKPLRDKDIVANFYVYLDESSVHPMGHTWVYVENLTDQELTVGLYKLQPGEGVSVGLFKRKDGWTIYYNIEAYSQTVYGMEGQISLKEELTLRELRRVSNAIIYYPNHWDPIFNCMFFSYIVWDVASFKILLPLLFPIIGKIQMLIYPHEFDVPMKPVTKEQTFRQSGMAGWAKLVPASDKVLGPV